MKVLTAISALSAIKDCDIETFSSYISAAKRIWLAGNGGSASIVSHFASDLSALGFDVTCMVDNISNITRLTNDFGWNKVYIEQMKHFSDEDVLIVVSVHGGEKRGHLIWSENLVSACKEATDRGGAVLALLGDKGGLIKEIANEYIIVPHDHAYIVEGIHSILTHLICAKLAEDLK